MIGKTEHDDCNLYYCNSCHKEFRDTGDGEWSDTHWELGADNGNIVETKVIDVCPYCESNDIEELPRCEICNNHSAAYGEEVCDECMERINIIEDILMKEFEICREEAIDLLYHYAEKEEWL